MDGPGHWSRVVVLLSRERPRLLAGEELSGHRYAGHVPNLVGTRDRDLRCRSRMGVRTEPRALKSDLRRGAAHSHRPAPINCIRLARYESGLIGSEKGNETGNLVHVPQALHGLPGLEFAPRLCVIACRVQPLL